MRKYLIFEYNVYRNGPTFVDIYNSSKDTEKRTKLHLIQTRSIIKKTIFMWIFIGSLDFLQQTKCCKVVR